MDKRPKNLWKDCVDTDANVIEIGSWRDKKEVRRNFRKILSTPTSHSHEIDTVGHLVWLTTLSLPSSKSSTLTESLFFPIPFIPNLPIPSSFHHLCVIHYKNQNFSFNISYLVPIALRPVPTKSPVRRLYTYSKVIWNVEIIGLRSNY